MNKYSAITHGMRLGFNTSLVLTCAYWILGILVEAARQMWLLCDLRLWNLPIAKFPGMLPFYLIMGLMPILFLGTLTGGFIGELWLHIGRRVDGRVFALLGLILCASIVVGFHAIYRIQVNFFIPAVVNDSSWYSDTVGLLVSYPFLVGAPSLLFITAGTWGSYLFWRAHQRDPSNSI